MTVDEEYALRRRLEQQHRFRTDDVGVLMPGNLGWRSLFSDLMCQAHLAHLAFGGEMLSGKDISRTYEEAEPALLRGQLLVVALETNLAGLVKMDVFLHKLSHATVDELRRLRDTWLEAMEATSKALTAYDNYVQQQRDFEPKALSKRKGTP